MRALIVVGDDANDQHPLQKGDPAFTGTCSRFDARCKSSEFVDAYCRRLAFNTSANQFVSGKRLVNGRIAEVPY